MLQEIRIHGARTGEARETGMGGRVVRPEAMRALQGRARPPRSSQVDDDDDDDDDGGREEDRVGLQGQEHVLRIPTGGVPPRRAL